MKTTLFYISMFLVLTGVTFTSCVHTQTQNEKKQQTPKEVKLQYEYNMFCPGDILEFADIEVTYADGDGNLVTDTISSEQQEVSSGDSEPIAGWNTNIKINVVPTRLYMSYRYLPKDGISAGQDKLVSTAATMYISTVNADQVLDFYRSVETPDQNIKANELKAYFEQVNENPPTLDYTLQETSGILNKLGLVKNN